MTADSTAPVRNAGNSMVQPAARPCRELRAAAMPKLIVAAIAGALMGGAITAWVFAAVFL